MPHPEETAAFRELPDDLQEPEFDPKEPKDAILSAPKVPKEWSKQCKWFGKYGLYKRWKPIVEDFYDTFILKKPLSCYLQVQIKTLAKLKNAHKEEYSIREFCNKYLEGFRAHLKSVERGSDISRYPTVDDAELYLFIKFGNPNFDGETPFLPDQENFLKYYRSQLIREYVNHRHNEPELLVETIGQLHSDYKPKQINQHLKQISNGLCWYSDDHIKNKCKKLS